MDNSLIKFGIGGVEHCETSAFGRLLQYVNYYGESGEFDCQGVKLLPARPARASRPVPLPAERYIGER